MLVERMGRLTIARDQPQRIRIARRLDRQRDEERCDRFAGEVQIAAKMTKSAMAVDRRYVDAAADRFRARRQDTIIHDGKRPDQPAKFGINALDRSARCKDLPSCFEAIPCLVDVLIARTKDRLEVLSAKTRPGIGIAVRPDPPGEVDPRR